MDEKSVEKSLEDSYDRALKAALEEFASWYNFPKRRSQKELAQKLNTQVVHTINAVEILKNQIDGMEESETATLKEEIGNIKETLSSLQQTSQEITAPVSIPPRDRMEVKLVPTTALNQLEEYRTEESKWFSFMGIFIGAILGLLVNLVTGGQLKPETWIILAVFAVMAAATGWTAISYKKRAEQLKNRF